jgi:methylenetetrahydrofolate reductase (NADPH)
MRLSDIFNKRETIFSFEFSPPRDAEAAEKLFSAIADLTPLKPTWVSVTYGAGGSTRELTRDLVVRIQKQTDLMVVAHLTCVGSSETEIGSILESYRESGITNVMALRGDPPRGESHFVKPENGFSHAAELVAFIHRNFPEMGIGVAGYPEGHPETPNRLKEIDYLKEKVDAGADYLCTQLFFDNHDYYDFCERCEIAGISIPIFAGIMPITSRKTMLRMAELAAGSRYPARLLKALSRADNDDHFEKVGIHWATEQVRDLIDNGARGIHFYTLNRSRACLRIYDALGVSSSQAFSR